ncbi:MAG TPA: DUF3089 domain-containing protein, partial [Alphaproteobacteria bacterium]|nr:DUF3089 domain-containing protein [Alphaproteobacteria bacterium]
MRWMFAAVAACAGLMWAGGAAAQSAPNDYSKDETWLCRPGRADACDIDTSATIVNADGSLRREAWPRNPKAEVDCFYVYPTVAADTTPNSDMIPGAEERYVVQRQLARFGKACRVFAPLYRQITIPALRSLMSGQQVAVDRELAYRDVKDAWNHYLKHDNGGRGVILYGHSQGSGVLKRLIAEEIDGKPTQKQIISAMLIGSNILVPKGKDVGGDFKAMPLCRSRQQTGCIITYVSFRESAPPPANSRFGRTEAAGMEVACTNPAALGGGSAVMSPVFGTTRVHPTAAPPPPWVTPAKPIETPYVRVPGLVSARCVSDSHGGYLAWRVNADPKDPRTDALSGDHLDAKIG